MTESNPQQKFENSGQVLIKDIQDLYGRPEPVEEPQDDHEEQKK